MPVPKRRPRNDPSSRSPTTLQTDSFQTPIFSLGELLFGKYRIEGVLGQGAMGVVYKAHNTYLDRHVAIKTIKFSGGVTETIAKDLSRRFAREARAAASIAHPNVVSVHDAGEAEGLSYIVMEFVEGESLQALLEREDPLPPARAIRFISQAAKALGAAHARGIIHRDIKPANTMIAPGDIVKVADFGIAKVLHATTSHTKEGSTVGTPVYMSPEQIQALELDGRSDLFSLAVVFYECVVGRRPFDGPNMPILVHKILSAPPEPFELDGARLTAAYRGFFAKALAKDPGERFGDADAFVRALEALPETEAATRADFSSSAQEVQAPTGADQEPLASNGSASTADLTTETLAAGPSAAIRPKGRGQSMGAVIGVAVAFAVLFVILGVYGVLRRGWDPAQEPRADTKVETTLSADERDERTKETGRAGTESFPAASTLTWVRIAAMASGEAIPFEITATEISNRQFLELVKARPGWRRDRVLDEYHDGDYLKHWKSPTAFPSEIGDDPVTYVSWFAASAYAEWSGGRLPTEQEWMTAARGRSAATEKIRTGHEAEVAGQEYPWGDEWHPDRVNCGRGAGPAAATGTAPVQSFVDGAAVWGDQAVYHMVGNVWEWVADRPSDSSRGADGGGTERLIKGGSYLGDALGCSITLSNPVDHGLCAEDGGFRVVR